MNRTPSSQQTAGLPCPECRTMIPVSIDLLLGSGKIVCPQCGLELSLDPGRSRDALAWLRKIREAENKVAEASTFRR